MSEHETVIRPTTWAAASNSEYITAADLEGHEVTVKIRAVELRKLENDKGEVSPRIVLWFVGKEKGMVSNTTNNLIMQAMFRTPNPQDIVGHSITIRSERVKFGRETVDGIRIVGSPDLERDIAVDVKLPRKKAERRTLIKTGAKPTTTPTPAPNWTRPATSTPMLPPDQPEVGPKPIDSELPS